jgi:hypothetical protein
MAKLRLPTQQVRNPGRVVAVNLAEVTPEDALDFGDPTKVALRVCDVREADGYGFPRESWSSRMRTLGVELPNRT